MRIAYLEDDAESAATVCSWLREAGYEVEWFSSGAKCARAIAEERFDACVLDWMVPDLSGTEVLARLQIKLRQSILPVIFATARDSEEDVVEVLTAGLTTISSSRCRVRSCSLVCRPFCAARGHC